MEKGKSRESESKEGGEAEMNEPWSERRKQFRRASLEAEATRPVGITDAQWNERLDMLVELDELRHADRDLADCVEEILSPWQRKALRAVQRGYVYAEWIWEWIRYIPVKLGFRKAK
jgi:hypothetical protein